MEQISAAENITIEMADDHWRLLSNGAYKPHVLVEAAPGQPLSYISEFARTRRLPTTGSLPVELIQQIVLGWSNLDESWHLGLLLDSELAEVRGSRWCEIAHWPDPSTSVFSDIATRAGESLAQVTTRPFHLVPPQPAQAEPEPPLPDLPLAFDDLWTLERSATGEVQFVRSGRWARDMTRRILWYTLWTIVYIILIVATLTSGIAPANPPFLPLLGVFAAMILAGLIGRNLYQLLTAPNRYVVDVHQRQMRAQRGSQVRWQLRAEQIQSVYVSQFVNQGKRRANKPAVYYAEINLHLTSGKFQHIITTEQVEDYHPERDADGNNDSVDSLTTHNLATSLQAAGLYVAQALDLSAVYDRRI